MGGAGPKPPRKKVQLIQSRRDAFAARRSAEEKSFLQPDACLTETNQKAQPLTGRRLIKKPSRLHKNPTSFISPFNFLSFFFFSLFGYLSRF